MDNIKTLWEFGEDNDGWYVANVVADEQFMFALSEDEARRIATYLNTCEDVIKAIECSQPPETTPWDCVDAIRRICMTKNSHKF